MKLFDYQEEDSSRMAMNWFLPNFSEAGTGKTYSTLRAIQKSGVKGGVIVAPSIALKMWKDEIEGFLSAEARIVKTLKEPLAEADFQIMSYAIATERALEVANQIPHRGDCVLVADESHYLKNADSARTKSIYAAQSVLGGMWCLTGTPIVAYPNDLYPMLRSLFPEYMAKLGIKSEGDFIKQFCRVKITKIKTRYGTKFVEGVCGSQNEILLNSLLYGKIGVIRRIHSEVSKDMPPLTVRVVSANSVKAIDFIEIEGMSMSEIMAALQDQKHDGPIATAVRRLGVAKVKDTRNYLEVLINDDKGPVLCGVWHKEVTTALLEGLGDFRVAVVDGSTGSAKREEIKEAFNNGELDVLIGQISAMGVSWNLQKLANRVVLAEDITSAAGVEQFVKRVWRIGQGSHVQVDIMKADVKLDDVITKIREGKAASAAKILGEIR